MYKRVGMVLAIAIILVLGSVPSLASSATPLKNLDKVITPSADQLTAQASDSNGNAGVLSISCLLNGMHTDLQQFFSKYTESYMANSSSHTPQFLTASLGYNTSFYSVFYITYSPSECSFQLVSINIVFLLSNPAGDPLRLLIISMDSSLSRVLNASYQAIVSRSSDPNSSGQMKGQYLYSGYEFFDYASNGQLSPITNTYEEWQVPSVSQPAGINCANTQCVISTWVGFSTSYYGGGTLIQTGTDSKYVTSASYSAWFEDTSYRGYSLYCNQYENFPVTAGDTMQGQTYQSSSGNPVTSLTDTRTGLTCASMNYVTFQPATTYYGQYMMEVSEPFVQVPKFATTTIYGLITFGTPCPTSDPTCAIVGIYVPHYFNEYILLNSYSKDIEIGVTPVSEGNPAWGGANWDYFTESWLTST
jgi:Peptidase A4 family